MSKPSIFGKRVIWASGTPNIYCPTDALDSWTRMETGAFAPSTSADYIPSMLTTSLWAVFGKHLNICDPSGHMVKILFLKWLKNYFFGYCRIKIPWSHLCPGQNGEDEHGHMKELNLVGMYLQLFSEIRGGYQPIPKRQAHSHQRWTSPLSCPRSPDPRGRSPLGNQPAEKARHVCLIPRN